MGCMDGCQILTVDLPVAEGIKIKNPKRISWGLSSEDES